MTYSIWLVPSKKDTTYLNKTIKNLAKQYTAPEFSAHITVYSGVHSIQKAKAAVDMVKSRPIVVAKSGIGYSDYIWKTLFVKIRKNKNLKNIHATLQKNLDTRYDFSPHISLIYKKIDPSTKGKIKSKLKIKNRFVFDRIVIIRSAKNVHNWKTLYSSSLNATRCA